MLVFSSSSTSISTYDSFLLFLPQIDEEIYSVEIEVNLGDSSEFLTYDSEANSIELQEGVMPILGEYTIVISMTFTSECTGAEELREIQFEF